MNSFAKFRYPWLRTCTRFTQAIKTSDHKIMSHTR